MSLAYYNENDSKAAAWLRQLISTGEIPLGYVDTRSIEDVRPSELAGYTQCHFFAGIGGWPLALKLAGWPDDKPVWTGSCPCQPFSAAGKRGGAADERHLWPAWFWLIGQCSPPVVFGEQVASKAGREWLSGVRADLETLGYAVGAADLCAASVGAPHIRQRLWWVAHRNSAGRSEQWSGGLLNGERKALGDDADGRSEVCERVGDTASTLRQGWSGAEPAPRSESERASSNCRLGHSSISRAWRDAGTVPGKEGKAPMRPVRGGAEFAGADAWSGAVWISCADGKARRIEPGIEPLVNGLPGRVGLLRGYGNGIVPQVAAEVITAYMEATR